MDVLFIHPNFPGQFKRLAHAFARQPDVRVHTLGDASWMKPSSLRPPRPDEHRLGYMAIPPASTDTHPYVQGFESGVRRGQQVVRTLLPLKHQGFEPHVIYVHPGWGDGLYLKDIFPNAQVIGLFEYYYHPRGADVGFDPEFPMSFDDIFRIRTLNSLQHLALESCDVALCPTSWQKSRYPHAWQPHLQVLHDGIDTTEVVPDETAHLRVPPNPDLPNGLHLQAGDEVLTFVSRTLEPYRGFHQLMRALPAIQRQRPACQIVIAGNDQPPGYGPPSPNHATWKAQMLSQLHNHLDLNRIHFTGSLPYNQYLNLLQVSRVHVYLTYPFVLSWSALEALSAGCLLVASDTAPVREFVRHQHNGLLIDFFDTRKLVDLTCDGLARPQIYKPIRLQARRSAQDELDFYGVIYPRHNRLISTSSSGQMYHPTAIDSAPHAATP